MLRAVTDAGFESLEGVVGTLYTTEFSEEIADERVCRGHSDSGWEGRVETMIGAIQKHSPTNIAHKAQLPHQRAVFSAAAPLYKKIFGCLDNLRVDAKPAPGDLDHRKWRNILHVDVASITPNFFAGNILGNSTKMFQDKESSTFHGVHCSHQYV